MAAGTPGQDLSVGRGARVAGELGPTRATSTRKPLVHGPRRRKDRTPGDLGVVVANLIHDDRFTKLSASHRLALLIGVVRFADGSGSWWPTYSTWARDAALGEGVVKKAAAAAEAVGLLVREPHAQPNGKQGSTTFILEPAVLSLRAHRDSGHSLRPETPADERGFASNPPEQLRAESLREGVGGERLVLESEGFGLGVQVDPSIEYASSSDTTQDGADPFLVALRAVGRAASS